MHSWRSLRQSVGEIGNLAAHVGSALPRAQHARRTADLGGVVSVLAWSLPWGVAGVDRVLG